MALTSDQQNILPAALLTQADPATAFATALNAKEATNIAIVNAYVTPAIITQCQARINALQQSITRDTTLLKAQTKLLGSLNNVAILLTKQALSLNVNSDMTQVEVSNAKG